MSSSDSLKKRKALYPGTFDPFTLGHLDIVERCCKIFDHVIVAVANPQHKVPLIEHEVRVELVKRSVEHLDNVEVVGFCELLVTLAKRKGANLIVRGIRAVSDYEYEMKMAWMNKKLYPELETVFLLSSEKYAYLSSSFVKEIFKLGGDISDFVPKAVAEYLLNSVKQDLEEGHGQGRE